MKVRLKIRAYGCDPGSVIEVSEPVGTRLLKDGDAEAVEVIDTPQRAKRLSASSVDNKAISAGARG